MAEPTIAYVVLCHHKADQTLRLAATIRRLSPRARVILRHNQRGYIGSDEAAAAGADLLVGQRQTRWGHWSLVEATLDGFRYARERYDPAWTVLISGQDYPVRPLGDWELELLSADYDAVVPGEPLVTGLPALRDPEHAEQLVRRYTHRWYRLPRLGIAPRLPQLTRRAGRALWYRYIYPLQAVITLNELPRDHGWLLGIRRRHVPWTAAAPAYKGEQWGALSRRALAAAIDGPAAAQLQRYFATTLVPDEAYFPTVLANTPGIRVKRESVSWLRWHQDVAQPHPVIIDPETLRAAVASGAPFARKFDEVVFPGLLDLVDSEMLALTNAA